MLIADAPMKLHQVAPQTDRSPHKSEKYGSPCYFISTPAIAELDRTDALVGQCQHDGHTYALLRTDLQVAWDAGKVAVVEGPVELVAALKNSNIGPGSPFSVASIFLHLDITRLDVRLREQGHREESRLMHEMEMAKQEMGVVEVAQGSGEPMVDHVFENVVLSRTYARVRVGIGVFFC